MAVSENSQKNVNVIFLKLLQRAKIDILHQSCTRDRHTLELKYKIKWRLVKNENVYTTEVKGYGDKHDINLYAKQCVLKKYFTKNKLVEAIKFHQLDLVSSEATEKNGYNYCRQENDQFETADFIG
jgi:hypothetical protein